VPPGGVDDAQATELHCLLARDLERVASLSEENTLSTLSPEARLVLQAAIATGPGRTALQSLDSSPTVVKVSAGALQYDANFELDAVAAEVLAANCRVQHLQLVALPAGSFPTYRLSEAEALGAYPEAYVAEGVHCLVPTLDLTVGCVERCYFSSPDGKAGAVKKRGKATRLQTGWLDRLYWGVATGVPEPEVRQGSPLLLQALGSREVLDHLLVPWLVTLQRPSPTAATAGSVPHQPSATLGKRSIAQAHQVVL